MNNVLRSARILIISILLLGCSSMLAGTHPGYEASHYQDECMAGEQSPGFPLVVKWCLKLDLPVIGAPLVHNRVIYVLTSDGATKSAFYALDAVSSNIIWKYETGAGHEIWRVVGDYVVTSGPVEWGHAVVALDGRTGREVWKIDLKGALRDLVVGDNQLYIAEDGPLYQVDLENGSTLWTFHGLPSHYTFRAFYDPADSTIVVPADDYYVIEAHSGNLVYQGKDNYSTSPDPAVVYHDNLIYGDAVLNLVDGTRRYGLTRGDSSIVPIVISDTIYYQRDAAQLVAYNMLSYEPNWVYSFKVKTESPSGRFYISNLENFRGNLYIFTSDDQLRAISLTTGQELGHWHASKSGVTLAFQDEKLGIPTPLGLATSSDALYVSLGTNVLYALEER